MESTVLQRINTLIKITGISVTQLSKEFNMVQTTLNRQISGLSQMPISTVEAFLHYFNDISAEWLLTGNGEMKKTTITEIYHPKYLEKIEEEQSINLYDIEAAANLKTLLINKDQNIIGKIVIPNIPKCDGAVNVKGDSMYPLLKSGDIVAYKEVSVDVQHIFFGEMYLVSIDMDGEEYLTVKYLQQSERGDEWVKLVSYNQNHQPKDFPLYSIKALALIKFSIRMNTMK